VESADAHGRDRQRETEAAGGRYTDAHARERAGAGRDREPLDVLEGKAGSIERCFDHRHEALGMAAHDPFRRPGQNFKAVLVPTSKRHRALRSGRVESEKQHQDRLAA
jgi:hypothetical protein